MYVLPPPEPRPSLLRGLGILASALVGAAVLVGIFTIGAMLAVVLGGVLLIGGAGLALALKLGWKPSLLRQAEQWQRAAQREQPLDGEYTVVGRGDREPRA